MKPEKSIFGLVIFLISTITLFGIFLFTPKLIGLATSSVTVAFAPEFNHSNPILNQSFNQGTTLSDVFDLDNHFSDQDSNISYRVVGNSSIIVTINGSNVVSYSHTSGFFGNEILLFYAYDELELNASSNNVTITVNVTGGGEVGGGAGGGGGAGRRLGDPFTIEPEEISIKLKQGEYKSSFFSIKNNLEKTIYAMVDLRGIVEFLYLSRSFSGSPSDPVPIADKEEKFIDLTFFASDNIPPDIYIRKIFVRAENTLKDLLVIISISSKDIIYNVFLNIPGRYKELHPGEMLVAEINLARVSGEGEADVSLELEMRDILGNIISREAGAVSVNDTLYIRKEFLLPQDIALGKYVLISRATYANGISVDSDTFSIVIEPKFPWLLLFILLSSATFLIIVFRLIRVINEARKIRKILQMMSESHSLLRNGRVGEAIVLYNALKERFRELSPYTKRRIWADAKLLS